MLLAHLADTHLGLRLFPREERGLNLRERDAADAFQAAVRELVRLGPDLVLVAGDVFDRPHPPATALAALARGLDALRHALPGTPVLLVAGARDTPLRPADPGPLAVFDALDGVEAAAGSARSIRLERLGVHALLLPHRALARSPFPEVRPDPDAKWNILVARGEPGLEGPAVNAEAWDYVALGCGHGRSFLGTRAVQAGSLERVGLDPWLERDSEKGFVTFDLETGESRFHAVPGRPVIELVTEPPDSGGEDLDLDAWVARSLAHLPGEGEGALLRLRLRGRPGAEPWCAASPVLARLRGSVAHLRVLVEEEPESPPLAGGEAASPRPPRVRGIARRRTAHELAGVPVGGGLVALIARDPPVRRELLAGLRVALAPERGTADPPPPVHVELENRHPEGQGADDSASRLLTFLRWTDPILAVETVLHRGARLLAALPSGAPGAPEADSRDGLSADVEELERALASLREDAAELAGDLEASTMEWLRERQDAETQLRTYRERARELKGRLRQLETSGADLPCPTCGAILGRRYDEVRTALLEEWEEVVQDGTWWRKRTHQLEGKPDRLREMERDSIRLQSRIRDTIEELERARSGAEVSATEGPAGAAAAAIVRTASLLLDRLTGGELDGLELVGGALEVRRRDRTTPPEDDAELRPLRLAVRLALLELAAGRGAVPASVAFAGLLDDLPMDGGLHAVELLRSRFGGIPQRLVVTDGALPERVPELFDSVLEVLPDPGPGRPSLRTLHAGPGRIALSGR